MSRLSDKPLLPSKNKKSKIYNDEDNYEFNESDENMYEVPLKIPPKLPVKSNSKINLEIEKKKPVVPKRPEEDKIKPPHLLPKKKIAMTNVIAAMDHNLSIYEDPDYEDVYYGSNDHWKSKNSNKFVKEKSMPGLKAFMRTSTSDYMIVLLWYCTLGVILTESSEYRDHSALMSQAISLGTIGLGTLVLFLDKAFNITPEISMFKDLNFLIVVFSIISLFTILLGISTSSIFYYSDHLALASGALSILTGLAVCCPLCIFLKHRLYRGKKRIESFPL